MYFSIQEFFYQNKQNIFQNLLQFIILLDFMNNRQSNHYWILRLYVQ